MNHVEILFDLIPTLNAADILNNTLTRLGNSAPSRDKCSKLETYLNQMIYGKDGHSNEAERLANAATQYLENKFQTTFEQYDFSKNMLTSKDASLDKIPIEGYQAYQHVNRIAVDTVLNRLLGAQEQIKILTTSPNVNIEETSSVLNQLQELVNTAKALLNSSPDDMGIYGTKEPIDIINVNANTKGLIEKLDKLWQDLTFYKSMPLSLYDTGYVFERVLQTVSTGESFDEMTDKMIYERFSEKTSGMSMASRKGNGMLTIGFTIEPVKKGYKSTTGKKKVSQIVTGDNGCFMEIQGEFDDKQGKMDVNMKMPGDDGTFRASAKNWASFDSNGFGRTSLAAALMRSAGINEMLAYGIGLGWPKATGMSAGLHAFAKMSAIADIVVGLSQESGYADTLVINDRSKSHIYVYSLTDLLQKVYKNISDFTLGGYNEGNIQSDFSSMFDWSGKVSLSAQDYMNRIYTKLSEIQISVSSGILSSY